MSIACSSQYPIHLNQVRGVDVIFQSDKVLLDTPRTHEAIENADTPRLVVRAARASTAKRLLPHNGAGALLVVVHVTCSVAQCVGRFEQGGALGGESGLRSHAHQC